MNYKRLKELFATARDPWRGKPLAHETRIHQVGPALVIRHYSTDILCFFEDGTVDVHTGWASNCTKERLLDYANIRVSNHILPSTAGRRPSVDKMLCMTVNNQTAHFHAVAKGGYVRIEPNGSINMDTVAPLEVTVITDATGLRVAENQMHRMAEQINARYKMLGFTDNWDIEGFLLQHLCTPLEEAMQDNAPACPIGSIKFPNIYQVAKRLGQARTIQIKTPRIV
jgi:hypothetical protein